MARRAASGRPSARLRWWTGRARPDRPARATRPRSAWRSASARRSASSAAWAAATDHLRVRPADAPRHGRAGRRPGPGRRPRRAASTWRAAAAPAGRRRGKPGREAAWAAARSPRAIHRKSAALGGERREVRRPAPSFEIGLSAASVSPQATCALRLHLPAQAASRDRGRSPWRAPPGPPAPPELASVVARLCQAAPLRGKVSGRPLVHGERFLVPVDPLQGGGMEDEGVMACAGRRGEPGADLQRLRHPAPVEERIGALDEIGVPLTRLEECGKPKLDQDRYETGPPHNRWQGYPRVRV